MPGWRTRSRLYVAALVVAVGFLSFLYGSWITAYEFPPYARLRGPLAAAKALHAKWKHPGRYSRLFYGLARSDRHGVVRHDPSLALAGYTLFSSGHGQSAYLVDMAGQLVHEWNRPLSEVWPEPAHLPEGLPPDEHVSVRMTHLFENGDLIALYAHGGGTPWGCGLVKMSSRSEVIWSYPDRVHHHFQVAADGRIYTLAHEIVADRFDGLPKRIKPPLIEDFLVVLSPDGELLQRVSVTEAFLRSEHSGVVESRQVGLPGDLWHVNSIFVLEPSLAAAFPQFEVGQVLISVRAIDALAVVDLEQRVVTWLTRGPWYQQHDAEFAADGRILVFDNLGAFGPARDPQPGPGARSRVLEIDAATLGIAWQHVGTADEPLYTHRAGGQQRLANGNTLISEFGAGRILEVTRDHQVAWEYHSPFRAPGDPRRVGLMYGAQRVDPQALHFEQGGPRSR
ncbi:MAG: hypothetical protein JRI23_09935 [Deltaproteobacteria bacterium]|jgi:hypothetical protein|nr:hypothetical protein [Deltaproteobacteria bacterium]MBW2531988.1 hypothetical protein [Deltaproteobacteria bacterium]